jgi:hypothetical protein
MYFQANNDRQIMNANGDKRKPARKVGWSVAMSTAAYAVEAIWEGRTWLLDGFDSNNMTIGRAVVAPSALRWGKCH